MKYVQTDVTDWGSQLALFEASTSFSPNGAIDYVIANAGIAAQDAVFSFSGSDSEPIEPSLKVVDLNLHGALYTTKLALHYFMKQNGTEKDQAQSDTCLVLIGSSAAFLDVPKGPQYSAIKWAMRGVMHSLRRTAFYYGSRVNMISPR